MIKRGFDETATKQDVEEIRSELSELKGDIADLKKDVTRIENILVGGLSRRVERLEDDMRLVKTKARI